MKQRIKFFLFWVTFILRQFAGWAVTRRSAAVHWGEGRTPAGYYLVQGWHWEGINGVGEVLRATTSVDNCSIYDGWWEL